MPDTKFPVAISINKAKKNQYPMLSGIGCENANPLLRARLPHTTKPPAR